ncbi:MAG: glycosyltransferase family 2 protein [Bacteroidia bacterium]|nr:glycosyltransferase family 2 protein [Bacteroidia bacterium]
MSSERTCSFSVIIPTFNRKVLLEYTLDALAAQTYQEYEAIVVDDGGSDGTEEMVRQRADARLRYHRITNSERGAARNAGTALAKGDYITFLDSDDLPYPDLLENAAESVRNFNFPAFLHVAYEIREPEGKVIFDSSGLQNDDTRLLITGNPLSCIGAFLRKDTALRFKFNEDRELSGSEDWELWLRVVANCGIKVDPRISSTMINHGGRSVIHTEPVKLYRRKDLALQYAFADEKVREVYGPHQPQIEAFADSYVSLHLALAGFRKLSVKYFLKAVRRRPAILMHTRSLVICKRILLGK